jgi:MFS family permease
VNTRARVLQARESLTPDERSTWRLDLLRNGFAGFIDACERTFFLLIAITLSAGPTAKSLIAAASGFGFLFSPYVVQRVRHSGRTVATPAAALTMSSALMCLAAAVFANRILFVIGAALSLALTSVTVPLMTALYNRNYPEGRRGRYVSSAIFVRVALTTALGLLVGEILERRLEGSPGVWRLVPLVASISYGLQAVVIQRIPSGPLRLRADEPQNEREAWKVRRTLLRQDALLRNVLISWMFMGFANLMMLPLRVEYVQNPDYGIALGPRGITLLTTVVPALVRLVLTIPFGWAFDRLSFFAVRILVNAAFATSIVSFFLGKSMTGLVIGAITFGIAGAGGDVLWNLWTIKFAPPGRVADYMALHTFFTGVRATLAPFVGFFLISRVSIPGMGVVCATLIMVASLILVPQFFEERRTRLANP